MTTSKPTTKSSTLPRNAIALGILLLSLFVVQSKFGFLEGWTDHSTTLLKLLHRDSASLDDQAHTEAAMFNQMRTDYEVQCPVQKYQTHIFSTDPLMIYIEDYLSYEETRYLLHLADPLFIQSPVSKGYRLNEYDLSIRSSKSAVLPRDPIVACIEKRTMDFQGYQSVNRLEDLQVVKYGISDQFRPHFDWFGGMENPRVSTIFAYLECDDCVGGSTQFPHYRGAFPANWCKFIDCEDNEDNRATGGVGFKPIRGNAVFWRNLYENGTGHPGVWHAGMPVHQGRKFGLNIFTRMQNAYVGDDTSSSVEDSSA